jgi:adenylylsulfate kinase
MGVDGDGPCRALLVTGPVGVGKTTVAEAVGGLLAGAAIPHAVIDLDWLACCWPSAADDRFNLTMQLRNLRSVARNYLDAGADRLVLAGVVESRAGRERYAEAVGVDLAVCRLSADLAVVRQRLVRRYAGGDDDSLRWHLRRSSELERILGLAGVEDFTVAADRPVADVAKAVVTTTGWL